MSETTMIQRANKYGTRYSQYAIPLTVSDIIMGHLSGQMEERASQHQSEIEALAEKLLPFVHLCASIMQAADDNGTNAPRWAFDAAEAFLAERDRRRGKP
jgi:hypothetical protein